MLAWLDGWCSACNWHAASTLSMAICSVQDFPQKMYKDATVNATHWCCQGSNSTIRKLSLYQKTVAVHFPVQDVLDEGLPLYCQDCGNETMIMCDIEHLHWLPEELNWSGFQDGPTGLTEGHHRTCREIDGDPTSSQPLSTSLRCLQILNEQRWLTAMSSA